MFGRHKKLKARVESLEDRVSQLDDSVHDIETQLKVLLQLLSAPTFMSNKKREVTTVGLPSV